jgi:precorrin-2 methylase
MKKKKFRERLKYIAFADKVVMDREEIWASYDIEVNILKYFSCIIAENK